MRNATPERMNPPPSAGEGAPRSGAGEGQRDGAGCGACHDDVDLSGSVVPLSRPASQATLPRRGGRVQGGAPGAHHP
ncbi:hypothetical protein EU555_27270 [Methylobacterium nonmethylotrophicum]|uniref:Uncharacterized protein n=1 Tax=Methylobacterium nonmethylotrophicum TaxID=1141884 RepID=A0A4Z0NJD9_9HYPH|nr:hypothetical protein EU555_27270 [Methylobacterium nonmethylotrophicum]